MRYGRLLCHVSTRPRFLQRRAGGRPQHWSPRGFCKTSTISVSFQARLSALHLRVLHRKNLAAAIDDGGSDYFSQQRCPLSYSLWDLPFTVIRRPRGRAKKICASQKLLGSQDASYIHTWNERLAVVQYIFATEFVLLLCMPSRVNEPQEVQASNDCLLYSSGIFESLSTPLMVHFAFPFIRRSDLGLYVV